jgi:hypothetical protein
MKNQHKLHDWDNPDQSTPAELSVEDDAIRANFPEMGATVWIELQDGRLRVHCYHKGRDEPVNVEIYDDRIELDAEDYGDPVIFAGKRM